MCQISTLQSVNATCPPWNSSVPFPIYLCGLFRGASLSRRAVFTNSLTHSLTDKSSNQKQDKYSTFTFTMTSRPYIKLYPYSIPIVPNYSLTILPSAYHTQWLFPKYLPHGLRFRGSAQWPEGPLRSEGIVLANASSFVKRTLINAICCLNGQLYLDGQPDLVPAFSLDVQLDLDEPFI